MVQGRRGRGKGLGYVATGDVDVVNLAGVENGVLTVKAAQ